MSMCLGLTTVPWVGPLFLRHGGAGVQRAESSLKATHPGVAHLLLVLYCATPVPVLSQSQKVSDSSAY